MVISYGAGSFYSSWAPEVTATSPFHLGKFERILFFAINPRGNINRQKLFWVQKNHIRWRYSRHQEIGHFEGRGPFHCFSNNIANLKAIPESGDACEIWAEVQWPPAWREGGPGLGRGSCSFLAQKGMLTLIPGLQKKGEQCSRALGTALWPSWEFPCVKMHWLWVNISLAMGRLCAWVPRSHFLPRPRWQWVAGSCEWQALKISEGVWQGRKQPWRGNKALSSGAVGAASSHIQKAQCCAGAGECLWVPGKEEPLGKASSAERGSDRGWRRVRPAGVSWMASKCGLPVSCLSGDGWVARTPPFSPHGTWVTMILFYSDPWAGNLKSWIPVPTLW